MGGGFPYTIFADEATIVKTSSTQQLPLGTRAVLPDGRVFRYAQAGATLLGAYRIASTPYDGPWSSSTTIVFAAVQTAGDTKVMISATATGSVTANFYKDGWLIVHCTDTNYTQMVKIDSHGALTSSTAAATTGEPIYLDKKTGLLKTVATETALLKLIANPYRSLIIAKESTNIGDAKIPAGVPVCEVAATKYFWLQTWGPCLVLGDTGVAAAADRAGVKAVIATGGTGAYCSPSSSLASDTGIAMQYPHIGVIMTAPPADTFFAMINLQLAP